MAHPEARAPLARLLGLASKQLSRRILDELHAAGFDDQRPAHEGVFPHVPEGGIRLTVLADRSGMTKQAMAELVTDLEGLGYLRRSPDPEDRRAKLIEFTDRGWAAVAVARRALAAEEAVLVDRVGEKRVRELRRTLLEILPSDS